MKENRNASQRFQDLEQGLMSLNQTVSLLVNDVMAIKEALRLLVSKTDAIIKAQSSGQTVNDEVISAIMMQNKVEELKEKVSNLQAQGILVEEGAITESSFVVGEELDLDGTQLNPRVQFTMSSMDPKISSKLVGAKVGDIVVLEEGKAKFLVKETYTIKVPETAPEPKNEGSPQEAV